MLLRDRTRAGAQLAERLVDLDLSDPVVLALPRGGVPVGFEIARALSAPLDVIVVRKLGVPGHQELAMGAVGEDGVLVVDAETVAREHVSEADLARAEQRERRRVEEQAERFRQGRSPVPLEGRSLVVADDGVATGSTMRAACRVARVHGPTRVVIAVPVGPAEVVRSLRDVADDVVCLHTPEPFMAVGLWYGDFTQVNDQEVVGLLRTP